MQQETFSKNSEDQYKSLFDKLLEQSRLYRTGEHYKELLDFMGRVRHLSPFNAMLVQIQKPGLLYAAFRYDWLAKFGRRIKEDARPLIILWPFGPVKFVYDFADTEGEDVPKAVLQPFSADGYISEERLNKYIKKLSYVEISTKYLDWGAGLAGNLRVVKRSLKKKEKSMYAIRLNRSHSPTVQFSTLIHELGHLYLGHLGQDVELNIKGRTTLSYSQREIEAESVAYIVCMRQKITPNSDSYLSGYIDSEQEKGVQFSVEAVCTAAGRVETMLGIRQRFQKKE